MFSSFAFASFGQNIKIKTIKNFYTKAQVDSLNSTSGVISVNTRTGAIVLTSDSIPEGIINKYGKVSNLAVGAATSTGVPITNSNGTGFTLGSATTTVAGLLRAADKIVIASLPDTLAKFIRQNGNTYAGPVTIGTNDNNVLNFETNNIVRGGVTTGGNFFGLGFESSTAPTNGLLTLGSGGTPTTISRDLPDGVSTFNVNNINGLSTANILTLQSGGSNVFSVNKAGSVISGGATLSGTYSTSAILSGGGSSVKNNATGVGISTNGFYGYFNSDSLTADRDFQVSKYGGNLSVDETVRFSDTTFKGFVVTTNATPLAIVTIPVPTGKLYSIEVRIMGSTNDDPNEAIMYHNAILVKNEGGTATILGPGGMVQMHTPIKTSALLDTDVSATTAGANVSINAIGNGDYTIFWKAYVSIISY